jgi:hypothetical protein
MRLLTINVGQFSTFILDCFSVDASPVLEAIRNKEFTFYGILRQPLLEIVSMADKFGPMQGTCTKKFVRAKPGDPAKDLYCINPTKIFAISGRLSIE